MGRLDQDRTQLSTPRPHQAGIRLPLTARSIQIAQGYCEEGQAIDDLFPAGCARLDSMNFPGVEAAGRGYDARLVGVDHSTTLFKGGMEVALEKGLGTCEPL